LAALARVAASAHERADGSGYARGDAGEALPRVARLLAAADVVAALGEARPYRAAHDPSAIERIVAGEVAAGRLDREAADAVLSASGLHLNVEVAARPRPAGLSEREVEVLALLARGRSNKEIARVLGISPKTVGHQVMAAYRKAGVRTRAAATLFALEHRLLDAARHR
jgi:DNA-binding NarL/FixJ family response regulator